MLSIGTVALLLAAGIGMLAGTQRVASDRGSRASAARRIEEGRYGRPVVAARREGFPPPRLHLQYHAAGHRRARDAHYPAGVSRRADGTTQSRVRGESHRPAHHATTANAFALILIDLRNLPEINASLGHHVGDEALSEAARRLRQNVAPNDLVARVSAQQFLIMAAPCSLQRAPLIAEQLTGTHLDQFRRRRRRARTASDCRYLRSTRNMARTRVSFCAVRRWRCTMPRMRAPRLPSIAPAATSSTAAASRSSPSCGARSSRTWGSSSSTSRKSRWRRGRVKSLEALARWTHAQLGAVSPAEFVPLAEQTGNTRRLTSWVVEEAIRQMAEWRGLGLEDRRRRQSVGIRHSRSAARQRGAALSGKARHLADKSATGDHRERGHARSGARRAAYAVLARRGRALCHG